MSAVLSDKLDCFEKLDYSRNKFLEQFVLFEVLTVLGIEFHRLNGYRLDMNMLLLLYYELQEESVLGNVSMRIPGYGKKSEAAEFYK